MFLLSQCCCDEPGEGAQCVFFDDFEEEDVRYDAVDFSGNDIRSSFTALAGVLSASESGSYTLQLNPNPPEHITVETVVEKIHGTGTAGSVSSGVTVHRADDSKRVSLVRVWDVTDGYELRVGGTAIASFTASGPDNFARMRLRLEKNGMGGWDALAYAGTPLTLQHTETNITFSKPDGLSAGLISENGGLFGSLKVSPCPIGSGRCVPWRRCSEVLVPAFWTFSTSGHSSPQGHTCPPTGSEDFCAVAFDGDWIVGSVPTGDALTDIGADTYTWLTGAGFQPGPCRWFSIFESAVEGDPEFCGRVLEEGADPLPAGRFVKSFNPRTESFGPEDCSCIPVTLRQEASGVQLHWSAFLNVTSSDPPAWRLTLLGWGQLNTEEYIRVQYESDETEFEDPDNLVMPSEITLNKGGSIGQEGDECDGPSSITLEANGGVSTQTLRRAGGCFDECEPFLNPNAANNAVVTGQIGGDDYCGFVSATFNEETFSWEFEGLMSYTDSDDGVLKQFTIRIECVELEEGGGRNWRLFVDSDMDTTILPIDALDIINGDIFNLSFLGEVVVDGETQPIDGIAGECNIESHAFAECCDEETLCCGFQSVGLWAAASCLGPHPCDGGSTDCDALVSSLSPTSPDIWSGDTSVDDGIGGTYRVELECVGGAFELRVIDSADDVTTKNVQCSNCAGGSFELFTTNAVPFEGQIPACCGGPPAVEFLRLIPT